MTYRVLITDEYGYTDVLADGFATREQAEKFAKDIKGYMWHPQHVEQWTELLRKLIDGALKASINNGDEVETEIYPPTATGGVVADLFTKMYGKDAVVATNPQILETTKYFGMDPIFFCTKSFCDWLYHTTETAKRMEEKAGSATNIVPKDKLPSPLKCIIDDLEQIAGYVTADTIYSTSIYKGEIKYAYLKEGVCGEARYRGMTQIAISIPCLIDKCDPRSFNTPEKTTTECVKEYISTLLHEIAHVVSQATDGTTAFEQRLTKELGIAVTNTLKYSKEISGLVKDIEDQMKKCE